MTVRILSLFAIVLVTSGSDCGPARSIPAAEIDVIREVPEKSIKKFIPPAPGKPAIAIVTHSTLDVKYLPLAIDNHLRYAEKHKYSYVFRNNLLTERYLNPEASKRVFKFGLYWQKIQAVQDTLNEMDSTTGRPHFDYVVWIDADAVFTNFDKTFEKLINQFGPEKDFFIARENFTKVNSGVFIVRNSLWSRQMFEDIANSFSVYKNEQLPEQQAIQDYVFGFIYKNARGGIYVLPTEHRNYDDDSLILEQVAIMPQRTMNSFYKGWFPWASGPNVVWEPGDFIAHFAVTFDEKERLLSNLLKCFKERGGENYQDSEGYRSCQ